ncbi:MAG TPA: PQQ-binding-like beta-propeller repeat protein [Bryobacteraceae bacterium]|nr:PQQ-binding-like beta-propeller repeat protein [Bryobacteraceae bacterium]
MKHLRILQAARAGLCRVALFTAAISLATVAAQPLARSATAGSSEGEWLSVDHDLAGTRFSPLNQINTKNVAGLEKVCSYSFPEKEPAQTAPIVVAGVMYVTTAHYTTALDGFDCGVLWTYRWQPRGFETFNSNRGAAFGDGRIIRGTADGFLLALNAKNGRLVWLKQIANPDDGNFISMPPLIHGDLIYIGPAGAEWAARGWVGAFRLADGKQVWRFNIVPGDGEPGAESWGPSPETRQHGGGNLWTPLSYDVEKNLLYVPGGNAAPDLYGDGRPGADLYTNSIIALDGKTGRMVWYQQFVPHDLHDYDVTHVSPIFRTRAHTLIATTGKDGLLRVLDRDSHNIVYSVPFTTRRNTDSVPAADTQIRVCPGPLGGNEWNGPAFSPALKLVIVPATDWCAKEKKGASPPHLEKDTHDFFFFGGELEFDRWSDAHGWLTAFDSTTGAVKWRYSAPKPMIAGLALTAGDLGFTGELSGDLIAFDARSGKILFRGQTGGPVAGGVITYESHGMQNVAAVSGYVGAYNAIAPEIGGGNPTVTIFRLPKR